MTTGSGGFSSLPPYPMHNISINEFHKQSSITNLININMMPFITGNPVMSAGAVAVTLACRRHPAQEAHLGAGVPLGDAAVQRRGALGAGDAVSPQHSPPQRYVCIYIYARFCIFVYCHIMGATPVPLPIGVFPGATPVPSPIGVFPLATPVASRACAACLVLRSAGRMFAQSRSEHPGPHRGCLRVHRSRTDRIAHDAGNAQRCHALRMMLTASRASDASHHQNCIFDDAYRVRSAGGRASCGALAFYPMYARTYV